MATSRRMFLVNSTKVMVLLPAGYAFANMVGCGGSDSDNDCSTANQVVDNGTTLTVTSDCVGDHAHNFSVQDTDLATPPAAGVNGDTTSADGHTHTVALTEAELQQIEAGTTVSKESGETDGHTHTFGFSKTPASSSKAPVTTPGY